MWITRRNVKIVDVDIVEFSDDLKSYSVKHLKEYLENCIETGRHYQLFDFNQINEVDNECVDILTHFSNQGICVSMFNVKPHVIDKLKMDGRAENLKIYDKRDVNEVVACMENDIFMKMAC